MKRSKFSLSYYKLLSMNQGDLVPIGITEVLPGDSIQQATSAFIRVSPLVTPVMHPVRVKIHHWFVPSRLLMDSWEDFITGGPDNEDATTFPTISMTDVNADTSSLADYFGIPKPANGSPRAVNALPFRAYALIWNENYRDQDLQTPLVISKGNGTDSTTSVTLQKVAWEKDYLTTARPFAEKGPEVVIPLTGDAPVKGIAKFTNQSWPVADTNGYQTGGTGAEAIYHGAGIDISNANRQFGIAEDPDNPGFPGIYADLANAGANIDIRDLRWALALQRWGENRARFGSRYVEYLAYLGVRSSDARLQRPEYLGGGKQTITFSEVLQSAPDTDEGTSGSTGVGNLKGHGVSAMRSNRYRRFFEEHGYIITVMYVMPKTIYADGLARMWNRRTRMDFWQQEFQHVGQQAVLYKEAYMKHSTPDGTFGYQDRYDEYRRNESNIAGEFRTVLDDWHMARMFSSDVALNEDFIKANPTDRIYASTATDQLYVMANHSMQARRLVAHKAKGITY